MRQLPVKQEWAEGDLGERFRAVRQASVALARPLSAEDASAQSMPDASPVKWHLGHGSWFFETFMLAPHLLGHAPRNPAYRVLFNSYYNGVGAQFDRGKRGLLTRPSLDEVLDWRAEVDAGMATLLAGPLSAELCALVEMGLAHEEQHQELILTDLKHLLAQNPLKPAYAAAMRSVAALSVAALSEEAAAPEPGWTALAGGLLEIGHSGDGFHFDNEAPRHKVWLERFELARLPVTNGDWLRFIDDGGYRRPELWLSAGWAARTDAGWDAPLYWRRQGDAWLAFTLHGEAHVDPAAPVTHISFYEAEAFARWAGARLPTEAEWEVAAQRAEPHGQFADNGVFHPLAAGGATTPGPQQMFGTVWEWTRSDYAPYPGYCPAQGAVGEYNGKFMVGQQVLRGGSCATPQGHVRATYRNFFPPDARWQFSGLRLARDLAGDRRRQMRQLSRPAGGQAEALARALMADPPTIAPGNFYDRLGSRLFEAITDLPEYGVTRAEATLFAAFGEEIAADVRMRLGDSFQLVDLGAGNCAKAEALLPVLRPSRYVAVDISADFLESALERVRLGWPGDVIGLGLDFAGGFRLPEDLADRPTLFFYPGSSIGNFTANAAARFLAGLAEQPDSAILLGADLVKASHLLEAAYDDGIGLTAAFNRNILVHVNRQLGSDFDPRGWCHLARYDEAMSRVEMLLEAIEDADVHWPGGGRHFPAGTRILTEISTKWTPARLTSLLREAGFPAPRLWMDAPPGFALVLGGG